MKRLTEVRTQEAGVSVEDQENADFRVPDLLASPAAVRVVSAEPLLGCIDFGQLRVADGRKLCGFRGSKWKGSYWTEDGPRIDQIIVGGESGRGARPMHPDWARAIRDDCQRAGARFFFKQWGEWAPCQADDGCSVDEGFVRLRPDGAFGVNGWPMQRVGKKFAGRLLDGREWSEFPQRPEALAA